MMRNTMMALAALSVAFVAGCSPPPAPPPAAPKVNAPEDITAVNAVRERFMAAYHAGDAQGIAALYTADAVSQANNTPTLTGRDAILQSQKAMFDQVAVKVTLTPDETVTRGDTGYDRGRFTAEATPKNGGPVTTNEGRYLVLLVKEADGSWRVARDMDNSAGPTGVAAAPAAAK